MSDPAVISPSDAQRAAAFPLLALAREAVLAAAAVLRDATGSVRKRLAAEPPAADRPAHHEQRAAHGLAWVATYVESIRQLFAYAERTHAAGQFGEIEDLIVRIGLGEYLAQILGGIPMSQTEIVRPADLGLAPLAGGPPIARPPQTFLSRHEARPPRAP